jgi:hypothetical protein
MAAEFFVTLPAPGAAFHAKAAGFLLIPAPLSCAIKSRLSGLYHG